MKKNKKYGKTLARFVSQLSKLALALKKLNPEDRKPKLISYITEANLMMDKNREYFS